MQNSIPSKYVVINALADVFDAVHSEHPARVYSIATLRREDLSQLLVTALQKQDGWVEDAVKLVDKYYIFLNKLTNPPDFNYGSGKETDLFLYPLVLRAIAYYLALRIDKYSDPVVEKLPMYPTVIGYLADKLPLNSPYTLDSVSDYVCQVLEYLPKQFK